MSNGRAECETIALIMRGHAAKEGITKEMEDAIEELNSMHLRYKNELGPKGEASFFCALAVFNAELQP